MGFPGDLNEHGFDPRSGENREMTRQAIDLVLEIWKDPKPGNYKSKWWEGLAGAAVGYAVFYPFAWIGDRLNRPIMGWGDVKLSAALGTFLGLAPLLLGLYLGVLVGGFVVIIVYAARLFGFNRVLIPYGPYLVAGGIISILYFREIADWISTQL
ncbi:MAG TPA: prepilin peptidase [Dehalococcoidia bacterium]|nr:prepilin peptidase [Dehalococcoidia bacterium]HIK88891.1 prepilin peptidase [Dehalococcoidia bacterium]